jgi:tetratricopeptide (TPR) repeat protein
MARAALLACAVLLGGCVYYNGMYNTNRLARSARKAERDGRPSEAQGLWGQVVTRADSLIIRHPRSKYADQANVIRGLALARLNQCQDAVEPLGRLGNVQLSPDLTEEAALALGRCQLELGDAGLAYLAFARVVNSTDSTRRREARYRHARALRMTGHYDEALAVLRDSPDPRGRDDLLLSLAGTGRVKEALAVADSVVALHDSSIVWDSVVAALGREDPHAASALVTRLGNDPRAPPESRARRLYDDAVRLEPVDSAAANVRYAQVARIPGATESGTRARLHLVRQIMGHARTLDDVTPLGDSLLLLSRQTSSAAAEAAGLAAEIARIRQIADSAGQGVPQGDLRLFLAAEAARDSLRAPALAATLFRRLGSEWTTSPYAPKALLAAQLIDPTDADAERSLLDSLYHARPYLALLRGEDAPDYRVLEDSLKAFAASQTVVNGRRTTPPTRPREDLVPPPGGRRAPPSPNEPVPGNRRHVEQ